MRQCGFVAGIELAQDPATDTAFDTRQRIGHQIALEARRRGAIVRPLGDVVVVMPPLSINEDELLKLMEIVTDSISAVTSEAVVANAAASA